MAKIKKGPKNKWAVKYTVMWGPVGISNQTGFRSLSLALAGLKRLARNCTRLKLELGEGSVVPVKERK